MEADLRLAKAGEWLRQQLPGLTYIEPLAGDASNRRYFRVHQGDVSWVLMDAPPDKEDVEPFLSVRQWMDAAGLRVPELVAEDRAAGFLILSDFGDVTWATALGMGDALDPMLMDALYQLHRLQDVLISEKLPLFDSARMYKECDLYLDWYLPWIAGFNPDAEFRRSFHALLSPIVEQITALPCVPVHLDYHSRNLMVPESGMPLGIIDFQDAVFGPVTYDLASLLYDCYQDYPEVERQKWSLGFYDDLPDRLHERFEDGKHWHRMVRMTAFQRHIKAIGIFARLAYRDGKQQFLDEIPLTQKHLLEEIRYLGLSELPGLIRTS